MDTRAKYLVVAWGDHKGGPGAAALAIAESLTDEVAKGVEIRCCRRLTVELAADVAGVEHVIFIDTHSCGDRPDLLVEEVEPAAEYSHGPGCSGPEELMALSQDLYGRCPDGWRVAARAFQSMANGRLSPRGLKLIDAARRIVLSMLPSGDEPEPAWRFQTTSWPIQLLN